MFTSSALSRCRQRVIEDDYHGVLRHLSIGAYRIRLYDFDLSVNDKGVLTFARCRADDIKDLAKRFKDAPENLYYEALPLLQRYHIKPPTVRNGDYYSACEKLRSRAWWATHLRRVRRTYLDNVARDIGSVFKNYAAYCSNHAAMLHTDQLARDLVYLQNTFIENEETGKRVALFEIVQHTTSNPSVRRAEMMARLSGFEEVAKMLGDQALFITLTCPSRFHAMLNRGVQNPKFKGESVQSAHRWLKDKWAKARAKFHRNEIRPYGFRMVEPHHDGTPHWHMVLFVEKSKAKELVEILSSYVLSEMEPGAAKHRIKTEWIDPTKGSATGYAAKYISKNTDGKHIEQDLHGLDGQSSASRISAWNKTHQIRQFQQIGGPSVGIWRELRRLSDSPNSQDIERARIAADSGDWASYVHAMGGIHTRRSDRPIQPYYEDKITYDTGTGEVLSLFRSLKGVVAHEQVVKTRTTRWNTVQNVELPTSVCSAGANGMGGLPAPPGDGLGLV